MDDVPPNRPAKWLLGVFILVGSPIVCIFAVAFALPFSTEEGRNFAGFIITPVAIVVSVMGGRALALKNPPKRSLAIVASIIAALGGFIIWFIGGMLEFPFVYGFTQLHIRNAIAWDGSPISRILGSDISDLTTDDYIRNCCADCPTITIFRMLRSNMLSGYYFAYDTKSNVMVPLSETAAIQYRALLPPGDKLEDWGSLTGGRDGGQFGDGTLAMPANWFHKIDLRENPSHSRSP